MGTDAISTDVVDGVAIVEWHELDPEDLTVGRAVLELLERPEVDAYVAIDRTDEYLGAETQAAMERTAEKAAECDVRRVGLVGEGIKPLAAKSAFDEADLSVFTTEDPREAVDWAREEG